MLRVGLSGGIGSGKSTVAARLAALGAVVIDADRVAREVVAPGTLGLAQVVDRFGPQVLAADGELDRAGLGAIVFADEPARRDLEAITHPLIKARSAKLFAAAAPDAVVVHDIPLLVEMGLAADYALTIIVDVPQEERLRRLVEHRGMPLDQARARIAAQASDPQRTAAADVLLDNSRSVAQLHAVIDELWHQRLVPFESGLRSGRHARRPEELTIVEPRTTWEQEAGRLQARLRKALGEKVIRADHVGSTSIPGLPAKDVIDLQVVVEDLAVLDRDDIREALRHRGFLVVDGQWWDHAHAVPTWPKRMIATADPGRVVHCHVRSADSPAWRLALLFRDWVRAEAVEHAAYRDLKTELQAAGLSATDYAQAKEPWFAEAFVRAKEWATRTGWSPAG